MSQKLNFMSARRIKLMLIFGVVFIVNTARLPAENVPTPHVDDPVIKAAKTLAESLPMEYKVKATADINLARQRLDMVAQHDAGSDRVYREAFERAKKIQNDYDRSQAFAQIARTIIPKDVNSYDEILKEESGYFVAEAIFEQCTQTGQKDLAYRIFEKIVEMQTDPEMKKKMRLYINRIYPTQIYTGKMDEAVASAERIKDPELRKFVLDQIQNTAQQHLLQLMQSDLTVDVNREAMKKVLKHCYPDMDCSNWPDCLDEVIAKMREQVEKMEDPETRFSAMMNLINAWRRSKGESEYYVFLSDDFPVPKAKPSAPDPVLQDMLKSAAKTAKKIDVDTGNYTRQKSLAIVARMSISNSDEKMANEIVDHMVTIPEQLSNFYDRKEAMFDVIPLLYQLKRTDEANKMCDDILRFVESAEGKRSGSGIDLFVQVINEKRKAGLFDEAEKMIASLPDKRNVQYDERLTRGSWDAYGSKVSLLLAVDQYEEALKFIDKEPKTLGEKIRLMQMVGDKYRESGNVKKSDEIYEKMFEPVDALAELVAKQEASGNRYGSDIKDDRHGWRGASLAKTYSHPIVKKRRERGDFTGAVSLAKALYGKHVPEVEILYIARGYADRGDYAGAMEVGGNDAGRFGSDAGIRGYVAHAMFKKGEKAEAEKLLADTLAEIESGRMAMHGDFIVGLMLCGKTDEALRFKATPVEIDAYEREQTAEEQSQQLLTLLLRCLLVSDNETRAMQLVDEWPSDKGKARGIWTLIHWNQEEHIDKETDTLLTPEWKKKWTAFFENYADTLEQKELPPSVHAGELNMAAECLINLDAKDAALKVLDKALEMDRIPDPNPHYFNATHTPMETGRLFFKLGEREKGTTAFTLAVQACLAAKEDYRKAESLKYVLEGYTEAIVEANPELIRNWPGYKERHGYNTPLKELWKQFLFSSYPIM